MSDDDWDTDPDFVNDVSEKQQRWGNKGVLARSLDANERCAPAAY